MIFKNIRTNYSPPFIFNVHQYYFIISQLMGMEAPAEYGGSEFNFMTTILAIEEIAKVDAAVAALVDIHNTLVVRFFKIMGNEAQKQKYLNILSTQGVNKSF